MEQSQYLAAALRSMSENPQATQPVNPMAMGRPKPNGQQDPNARPTIGDNLQQAWSNVQGAPGRVMQSFDQAGQNFQGAPQRFQDSIMGLGKLFK